MREVNDKGERRKSKSVGGKVGERRIVRREEEQEGREELERRGRNKHESLGERRKRERKRGREGRRGRVN